VRGSPLLHFLIGVIAFALFAIPVSRLTVAREESPATEKPESSAEEAGAPRRTFIRVRVAHVPQSLSLKLGDRELLPSPATSPVETEATIGIPKDGLELALNAKWPDGTPDTAVTIELEPDELESRRETLWSTGPALNGIITFKW
jgi:hypothetical protein